MRPAADSNALGTYLRARREQARPEAAGVPDQRNRRVPGLRREEVAFLAGVHSALGLLPRNKDAPADHGHDQAVITE